MTGTVDPSIDTMERDGAHRRKPRGRTRGSAGLGASRREVSPYVEVPNKNPSRVSTSGRARRQPPALQLGPVVLHNAPEHVRADEIPALERVRLELLEVGQRL